MLPAWRAASVSPTEALRSSHAALRPGRVSGDTFSFRNENAGSVLTPLERTLREADAYKRNKIRRRSSTVARVTGATAPHLWIRRSVEIERMASQSTADFVLRPPSGGETAT